MLLATLTLLAPTVAPTLDFVIITSNSKTNLVQIVERKRKIQKQSVFTIMALSSDALTAYDRKRNNLAYAIKEGPDTRICVYDLNSNKSQTGIIPGKSLKLGWDSSGRLRVIANQNDVTYDEALTPVGLKQIYQRAADDNSWKLGRTINQYVKRYEYSIAPTFGMERSGVLSWSSLNGRDGSVSTLEDAAIIGPETWSRPTGQYRIYRRGSLVQRRQLSEPISIEKFEFPAKNMLSVIRHIPSGREVEYFRIFSWQRIGKISCTSLCQSNYVD